MCIHTHIETLNKESKTPPYVGRYSFGESIHQSVIFLQPDQQGGRQPGRQSAASLRMQDTEGILQESTGDSLRLLWWFKGAKVTHQHVLGYKKQTSHTETC